MDCSSQENTSAHKYIKLSTKFQREQPKAMHGQVYGDQLRGADTQIGRSADQGQDSRCTA